MIKQIGSILFSMQLMAVLLAIFAISIATATFIENDYGTIAAKATVYNVFWFELLLGLLFVNLTGNIFIRKLYRKKKFTIFLFHLAFCFVLIGAFITRHFGEEGYMHIREEEQSDQIMSDNTFLQIHAKYHYADFYYSKAVLFSPLSAKRFSKELQVNDHKLEIKGLDYIPNAVYSLVASENGKPVIELITPGKQGRNSIFITDGDINNIGLYSVSFNDTIQDTDVSIYEKGNELFIQSRYNLEITDKHTWGETLLKKNNTHQFTDKTLYKIEGIVFVLKKYLPSGNIRLLSNDEQNEEEMPDALILEVTSPNNYEKFIIWGKQNVVGEKQDFEFEGIDFTFSFGAKVKKIPFSLKLTDFRLDRYPGSNSPSSFESEVVLIDNERNISEQKNIFMNNILKYRGYRFYQASYDGDEKGTVLSVNKDYFGTLFTYLGHIMLALGMFLSLFNKNSRFKKLQKSANLVPLIILFLFIPALANASETTWDDEFKNNSINANHARQFGELLIQDNGGRVKPVNTLSSQVLRKIARKDNFLGLNADQVFLGMLSNPDYGQQVPLIKVSHDEIKNILKMKSNFISFSDILFTNEAGTYLLAPYVEEAYRKKPAYRTKFDNEIIRVDERVNICFVVFTKSLLKIFPDTDKNADKWYSPKDSSKIFSEMDSLFVSSILPIYFGEINNSLKSGDWSKPDEYLEYIKLFQKKYGSHIMPSETKQKFEIWYNKLNIFDRLASFYGLVGFILLLFHFIEILSRTSSFRIIYKLGFYLILLLFAVQATGLILRWYVSGHAPWSNGYEALTYIAWATVLAGILFSKKSQVTLPATAILAFLILHVAHLSWMDPEITNLVPVLKSVWLVIHVAIITASYGFLALGALLALLNLILMNFKTGKNVKIVDQHIIKLTSIIEMTLIAGLYMLTIGTFLGGVWANESWGRYWGWDPKETWALITVLVYAFIAHMRIIPGLKGIFTFNLMALFGFSSVIMTYFGVNFYLSGLHSYAKGDPLPVPDFVFYTITVLFIISVLAFINQKRTARLA